MSEEAGGSLTGFILELCILLVAITSVVVLRVYFFQSAEIISQSMEPTFNIGDRFIYLRTQGVYQPQRGNVVSIQYDDTLMIGEELVKRVVGLPGEEIGIYNGHVYINGTRHGDSHMGRHFILRSYRITKKISTPSHNSALRHGFIAFHQNLLFFHNRIFSLSIDSRYSYIRAHSGTDSTAAALFHLFYFHRIIAR
jgi:signal peptidase I